METTQFFNELLEEYRNQPVDLLNLGDEVGEYTYLSNMCPTYIRTIRDISRIDFKKPKEEVKILEIGSYLGYVSISLSKLGFKVHSADLAIFMQNKKLQEKYAKYGIDYYSIDLQDDLKFNDEQFDCVIICETLEHLNFNPIPVLLELKRILKNNGVLYLSLPNVAKMENRYNLLKGKSISNTIDDFFAQLNPNCNFSVGIHWREYTKQEIIYLLEKIGFKTIKHYYFTLFDSEKLSLKFYIKGLWKCRHLRYIVLCIFKPFKESHTVICSK